MKSIRYAWRNLWRNKKRTHITLTALAFATAILIVSSSLLDGIMEDAVDNMTSISVGEVQVHAPRYLDDRSFYKSIVNPDGIIRAVEALPAFPAPRSYGHGLISYENRSSGSRFWGIDPAAEKKAFALALNMQNGVFLPEGPEKKVVLGRRLAQFLRADAGAEVVVVVQAADGSLGNDLYTVSGILKPSGSLIDRTAAIIHQEDFAGLFVSGGRIHEIAFNSKGNIPADQLKEAIRASAQNADVKTWGELLPVFSDLLNITQATLWLFSSIFFLVAGLGIMNTMLMAAYERTWEFGIMKALGTSPRLIIGIVLIEAAILSSLAALAGAGIGSAVSICLNNFGIDVSVFARELRVSDIIFNPVWRPELSVRNVVFPVFCIWTICLAASFYPAFLAARQEPVISMHGNY